MSAACQAFRVELERVLDTDASALPELRQDAHARSCAACALELRRATALERLLDGVPPPRIPVGLAGRTLAALAARRAPPHAREGLDSEIELDAWLESVPAPAIPDDLAARVLRGLEPVRQRPVLVPRARTWIAASLAAAVLLAVLLWRSPAASTPEPLDLAADEARLELDEELLAYAVERWDLLNDEDLDLWLASLDDVDQLLVECSEDEGWLGAEPPDVGESR